MGHSHPPRKSDNVICCLFLCLFLWNAKCHYQRVTTSLECAVIEKIG